MRIGIPFLTLLALAACSNDVPEPESEDTGSSTSSESGVSSESAISTDCPEEDMTPWYADHDGDGYGDPNEVVMACEQPEGFVDNDLDCAPDDPELPMLWFEDIDDNGYGDPDVSVLACEQPEGFVDNDLDCAVGDPDLPIIWYADHDADGFGDPDEWVVACEQPEGFVDNDLDCAPDDPTLPMLWFEDRDGDGFGDPDISLLACDAPSGFVDNDLDCAPDDPTLPMLWFEDIDSNGYGDPAVSMLACDAPDGFVDNDLDCAVGDPTLPRLWFADSDGDGFGDPDVSELACEVPSGFVGDDTDCDDTRDDVFPGAPEVCNDIDHSCDGDPFSGVAGSGEECAVESCLEVLQRGSPLDSGDYWLTDDLDEPHTDFCAFGPVADGWTHRASLTATNPTDVDLVDHMVPVWLDTEALISMGLLLDDGGDLRFFTHDGVLLEWWIDGGLGTTDTLIWVRVPELGAGDSIDLTLAFGNPLTNSTSINWLFEDFSADRSELYTLMHNWSTTPTFNWRPDEQLLHTDSTNADYGMYYNEPFDWPIYVEIRGWLVQDNDALGAALTDGVGMVVAQANDDYNGVAHTNREGIVWRATMPSAHYTWNMGLNLGNLTRFYVPERIGLYYDGLSYSYYFNGAFQGSFAAPITFDPIYAGLASLASAGNPGGVFDHLWVGPTPITFDPSTIDSEVEVEVGEPGSF